HIHKGQDWRFGDAPIVYPGSPRRTAFGEVEEKAYVVAEFQWAQLVGWERVVVPATPMILLEGRFDADATAIVGDIPDDVVGAEIRLRYHVESDRRDAAKAAAEDVKRDLLANGAISVKVEEVVEATTRARAPEIAVAQTIADKLEVFWRAKGIEVSEARRGKLFSKLAEVEAVHAV